MRINISSMADEFYNRKAKPNCDPCWPTSITHPQGTGGKLDHSDYTNAVHINAPIDPLPFNADQAAANYVVNQVAEDLAVAVSQTAREITETTVGAGGMIVTDGNGGGGGGGVPGTSEIAAMIENALSEAGASSNMSPAEVASNIANTLATMTNALGTLSSLGEIASWMAGIVNGGFGGNGALGAISSDAGAGGGDGGDGGGGGGGELELPKDKALDFWNDLNFLYQEFVIKPSNPMAPVTDLEFPLHFNASLLTSEQYETMSRAFSTYQGYIEEFPAVHWPIGFPNISPPGLYSFEDDIETNLTKAKRRSLKSLAEARILLLLMPTLFTFDPNRTREANRRCRTLKSKLFKVISWIPTMWDLWDGIIEWTAQYVMTGGIDKSQLFFESTGGYLRHSSMAPRLVRSSVARKNFSEDRLLCQGVYNETNDYMQYCMSDAYLWEEEVENSTYATFTLEWDEEDQMLRNITQYHPGVPTTTYKTQHLTWVGEKLKGDSFFHTVVLPMASPFPIAKTPIILATPLIEYLFQKAEITTIETYDWNTRTDFRRLAVVDYRGYKRMNKFETLDRSALDVINNE